MINDQDKKKKKNSFWSGVQSHLSFVYLQEHVKRWPNPDSISIYDKIHSLYVKWQEIHISPMCPICLTWNLRKESVFGWTALLSDRPVWLYCAVFEVPAGTVSKASHVSKTISVSTRHILLWPQPAHCAFWHTQCLSSFVESRTMRSSRWTAMHFPDNATEACIWTHKCTNVPFTTPKYIQ